MPLVVMNALGADTQTDTHTDAQTKTTHEQKQFQETRCTQPSAMHCKFSSIKVSNDPAAHKASIIITETCFCSVPIPFHTVH